MHQRKVEKIRSFLGIDPGLKGALALISDSGKILDIKKMPLRKDGKIDHDSIYKFVSPLANVHVFLERAVSFGMGSTSAFNYGRGFAALEISLELAGHGINYVMPQVWTRLLHKDLSKDLEPKQRSALAAGSIFGEQNLPKLKSGRFHDGVVDALLLAEYGRRSIKIN